MKKLITLAALSLAAIATPAMATDFTGPRVEVTAGADAAKGRRSVGRQGQCDAQYPAGGHLYHSRKGGYYQ